MRSVLGVVFVLTLLAMVGRTTLAADADGAGATFPFPLYAKWAEAYHAESGATISYQAVGSGLGIALVRQRTVTFGASDMPLASKDLESWGLVQFPAAIGADVVVVNVHGIASGAMTLDGRVLAGIYLGKITRWDDPAIRALNPALTLPAVPISVVHRSDGSGTTFLFADYLSKQSEDWKHQVGASTEIDWPLGYGAKGNDGVAAAVGQIEGAIGYVEYAFALAKKLTVTKLVNRSGTVVEPSLSTFRAAAAGADWGAVPDFNLVLTDQPGAEAWPITGATFILMPRQPVNAAASVAALRFFDWAYAKGAPIALSLNYVPMPDTVVPRIKDAWRRIGAK